MQKEIYYDVMKKLNRLGNQMDRAYHQAANVFGLSDCELDIFYSFSMDDRPRTLTELCEEIYQSKQTVSSAIQSMKKKGWISYETCEDKRKKLILLTEAGVQKRKETADRLVQYDYESMQNVSDEDIRKLMVFIQKYHTNIRERYRRLIHEKE